MSVEQIETVFTISPHVRRGASLLSLDDFNLPNRQGVSNISWRNERGYLNGCLLDIHGYIWCSCEWWSYCGKEDKFRICKHILQSLYFLIFIHEYDFVKTIIEKYIEGEENAEGNTS